jgi:outer membrane protein assembly factor BamB
MAHRWPAAALLLALSLPAGAEEWPGFRGPTGQGISTEKGLPTEWGAGDNVAWKADIPGEGWSSPVVWGERVFVTAATEDAQSCRVLALSRLDGKLLWNVEACRQRKTHKQDKNSYATPTPVTDGEHVYAVFNDGAVVALTVEGKPAWVNRDVKFYSQHGLGASPILYQDLLVMAFDGSSEGPDKALGWQKPWDQSFLLALDKKTGKERWRARRGLSRIAHTTPIVVTADGRDWLISSAGDVIQGFDPKTGERLWSVRAEGEGVAPSPVFGDGLVFAASGFGNPRFRAVRLAGDGDDTTRKVVWESNRNVPMIPSAVYVQPHLFAVSENGIAVCLEAATGKVQWQERLGGNYSASPVYADGHVYFLSEQGDTTVVKAGAEFVKVARNSLNEQCQASMAVSRGHLFIRTAGHVFCIGAK